MIGLLLYLVSWVIEIPLFAFNFFFVLVTDIGKKSYLKRLNGFFMQGAIARDRFGNYNYRRMFNICLLGNEPYYFRYGVKVIIETSTKFGDERETISSVLGKNQQTRTLSVAGWCLVYLLWFLDFRWTYSKEYWKKGGHCLMSIKELKNEL